MKGLNIKGKYTALRMAALICAGVPTDNLTVLQKMANAMEVPALTDNDVAASLVMIKALIATHDGAPPATLCVDEGCPHHGIAHVCIAAGGVK